MNRNLACTIFLLAALLVPALPCCEADAQEIPDTSGCETVIINEFLPAPFSGQCEWVELFNSGNSTADMSGWLLDDIANGGSPPFVLPNGTELRPGEYLLLSNSTTHIGLNDNGDSVRLLNSSRVLMDECVFNSSTRGESYGRVPDGGRLRRILRPTPGATNGGPRIEMGYATFDSTEIRTFVSPDCSYRVISEELDRAKQRLLLSVYQLENFYLVRKLVYAAKRGVDVDVLLEGRPVGGLTFEERAAARMLADCGASVTFFGSALDNGSSDRYPFVHAKYCVIDNLTCIVDSENWKMTGIPVNGTTGNIGWGVVARSPGLAAYLTRVFRQDSDPYAAEAHPYSPVDPYFGPPPGWYTMNTSVPLGNHAPVLKPGSFTGGRLSPVLSPDTSLLENASILGLIGTAARSLLIEEFSCSPDWDASGDPLPNLYLEAVIQAARRGVDVKVLLDGTYLDEPGSGNDNRDVLNRLLYLALTEGLRLDARYAFQPGIVKMHNKGLVADGEKVLVSSINWGRTSVMENREVGLILDNPGVASYFEDAFFHDWNASVQEPALAPLGSAASSPTAVLPPWSGILPPVLILASLIAVASVKRSQRAVYSPSPGRLGFPRWPALRFRVACCLVLLKIRLCFWKRRGNTEDWPEPNPYGD